MLAKQKASERQQLLQTAHDVVDLQANACSTNGNSEHSQRHAEYLASQAAVVEQIREQARPARLVACFFLLLFFFFFFLFA